MTKQTSKPLIESLINTMAIALTSFGTIAVTTGNQNGYLPIAVGIALEMLKYYGRNKNYW